MPFEVTTEVKTIREGKKRKAMPCIDKEMLGFVPVDKKAKVQWVWERGFSSRDGAVPSSVLPRQASALQIFPAIFTDTVLSRLRQFHSAAHFPSSSQVLEVFAIQMYIQFVIPVAQPGAERFKLQAAFESAMREIRAETGLQCVLTFKTWSRRLHKCYFVPDFIKECLSLSLESMVDLGSVVTLEEKLKAYSGRNSPCVVSCLTKPEQSGHWISQLGVVLHNSCLPFVTRIFPKTNCVNEGQECSMSDIIEWAITGLPRNAEGEAPCLAIDARYLSKEGRSLLSENNVTFLASQNPRWFLSLHNALASKVLTPGDWEALENQETGELYVHFCSSDKKVGKKDLTNALTKKKGKGASKHCPGADEYKVVFNVLDRFNQRMAGHYWQYRRMEWDMHIHDTVLTMVVLDIFHLWSEIHFSDSSAVIPLTNFVKQLSIEVIRHSKME